VDCAAKKHKRVVSPNGKLTDDEERDQGIRIHKRASARSSLFGRGVSRLI